MGSCYFSLLVRLEYRDCEKDERSGNNACETGWFCRNERCAGDDGDREHPFCDDPAMLFETPLCEEAINKASDHKSRDADGDKVFHQGDSSST